jgi:hypothetical protein
MHRVLDWLRRPLLGMMIYERAVDTRKVGEGGDPSRDGATKAGWGRVVLNMFELSKKRAKLLFSTERNM